MPESVCLSKILGNPLGRSLSPFSNSSWCICFTDPCGSRRKPIADKRNIVIDGIGGEVLSEALKALALGGSLTTLGYSASRKTTIDVTDLIVPQASIRSLNMFRQPQTTVTDAWNAIVSLLQSGAIKPIVAKTFPLTEAAEALRYLVEGRPFGRVVLTV